MFISWEDKLHDKMTSAYSKSCGYKKFSVHTNTKSIVFKLFHSGERFQKVPFSWIFLCVLVWTEGVSVTIKLRFQIHPTVWTGPEFYCKHNGQTLQLAVQSKRSLVFKYRYNYNWTVIYLHYLCLV